MVGEVWPCAAADPQPAPAARVGADPEHSCTGNYRGLKLCILVLKFVVFLFVCLLLGL